MISDLFQNFGAFIDGRNLASVLIPLAGIVLGGVIAVTAMYFHHHQKKMMHETARLALEKGQPISAELLSELGQSGAIATQNQPQPRNDIRAGLILIGVGIGLYMFFAAMSVERLRFVGAIPGLIGVALLLFGGVSAFLGKKPSGNDRNAHP